MTEVDPLVDKGQVVENCKINFSVKTKASPTNGSALLYRTSLLSCLLWRSAGSGMRWRSECLLVVALSTGPANPPISRRHSIGEVSVPPNLATARFGTHVPESDLRSGTRGGSAGAAARGGPDRGSVGPARRGGLFSSRCGGRKCARRRATVRGRGTVRGPPRPAGSAARRAT